MLVQLILAQGSRAGTTAEIQPGYYMIGRHAECQIRPKSRSVSRRHCLVHHADDGVRVLDLESTSGTRLNDTRLDALQWIEVKSGDQIRCGKVAFVVAIDADDLGDSAPSMVQGEAWQEFDIASFLESQDTADREKRYADIRSRAGGADGDFEEDSVDDDDVELSVGVDSADSTASATSPRQTSTGENAVASKLSPGKKQSQPGKLPSRSKASSAPPFDFERFKLVAAIIMTVAVLGFFVYKIVEFQSPPDVQVIEGID